MMSGFIGQVTAMTVEEETQMSTLTPPEPSASPAYTIATSAPAASPQAHMPNDSASESKSGHGTIVVGALVGIAILAAALIFVGRAVVGRRNRAMAEAEAEARLVHATRAAEERRRRS